MNDDIRVMGSALIPNDLYTKLALNDAALWIDAANGNTYQAENSVEVDMVRKVMKGDIAHARAAAITLACIRDTNHNLAEINASIDARNEYKVAS